MLSKYIKILSYPVSARGLQGDIEAAWRLLKAEKSVHYVACGNPHSFMVARHDSVFSDALKSADILLPDGSGVILAAKLLGRPLKGRVAGYEFFDEFSKLAEKNGGARYFFMGSSDQVLDRIVKRISEDFPSIEVCGVYSPPFKTDFTEEENLEICALINKAQPDVLWVGMTAPKQEKWIYKNKGCLDVPLIGAIGAVFDFYAGTKKRAPRWIRDLGFEWLPRFLREPRRLFRRNFFSSPAFLLLVIKAKLQQVIKRGA